MEFPLDVTGLGYGEVEFPLEVTGLGYGEVEFPLEVHRFGIGRGGISFRGSQVWDRERWNFKKCHPTTF